MVKEPKTDEQQNNGFIQYQRVDGPRNQGTKEETNGPLSKRTVELKEQMQPKGSMRGKGFDLGVEGGYRQVGDQSIDMNLLKDHSVLVQR